MIGGYWRCAWDGSRACVCYWCGVVVGGNLCLEGAYVLQSASGRPLELFVSLVQSVLNTEVSLFPECPITMRDFKNQINRGFLQN